MAEGLQPPVWKRSHDWLVQLALLAIGFVAIGLLAQLASKQCLPDTAARSLAECRFVRDQEDPSSVVRLVRLHESDGRGTRTRTT